MTDDKMLEYLRKAAADLQETRRRLDDVQRRAHEPIAVVGTSCRFPGGVTSAARLWDLVDAGTDAMGPFPLDRGWRPGVLPGAPSPVGGFLDGVAGFDADFFGISPREAFAMDPQQRLVLECAWEALEDAGLDPAALRGTDTGVFIGTNGQDYPDLLRTAADAAEATAHAATGNNASVLSGRVSYALGLEGPSFSVDTACSSSMVALHLAVQALRRGECSFALAGGVTVMCTPEAFVEFARQGGLAADGRCKAFSDAADGTAWGEGVGTLAVELLSRARELGHPVLAVVRGSAVNSDGASNGLTAPNGPAQQRVIRAALADARLAPSDVDVVEAHGTGTSLGDPIEAQALLATYGAGRDRPLLVGSVKSNIGHTQAAAGVAGLIKMIEAVRRGVVPRTLHVGVPSSRVDWSSGAVELATEARDWPEVGRPRRAGVSAFGISGTNAHVILEQAADEPAPVTADPPAGDGTVAWPVSARGPRALAAQAARLAAVAADPPAGALPVEAGWTLAGRTRFDERAVVLGRSWTGFAGALGGVGPDTPDDPAGPLVRGRVHPDGAGRVVFVFPGQGAQWTGMAWDLWAAGTGALGAFATSMDRCDGALRELTGWSLRELLAAPEAEAGELLERVDVVQPALCAVHLSLAQAWRACGVRPDAVLGHSQGEIAAACVAGVLTVEEALRVVVVRSRLLARIAGSGGMLSVQAAPDELAGLRAERPGLALAAHNGPAAVVLSGADADLVAAQEWAAARDRRSRRVAVDYASHSAHVDALREELVAELADLRPGEASVPFRSTVTGEPVVGPELHAGYWYRNLREPVRFDPAVRALAGSGFGTFVEVSAHPMLVGGVADAVLAAGPATGRDTAVVTGTLRRGEGGPERFLRSVAEVWVQGVEVDWAAVLGRPAHACRLPLPTYPFDRRDYWPDTTSATAVGTAGGGADAEFWAAVERADPAGLAALLDAPQDAVAGLLPRLGGWWRTHRQDRATRDWCHRIAWSPLAPAPVRAGARLLVVCPENAQAWVPAAVAALGARAELAEVVAARPPCDAVVSLLAGAAEPDGGGPAPVAWTATHVLLQALVDAGVTAPCRLLTRGGVATSEDDAAPDPVQAGVWGLGRVAGLERPDTWGGLLDLPSCGPEGYAAGTAALLARGVAPGSDEDQVAVRGQLWGRRLVPDPGPRPASGGRRRAPGEGAVLVTGGTGGIGARAARWLAARGETDVVLVSRSGADAPGAEELAEELAREHGTRVHVLARDVSRAADVRELPGVLADRGLVVGAVWHAAGVVRDAPLTGPGADSDSGTAASAADWAAVCGPKVAGVRHLDAVFGDVAEFVVFSSNAGVWGSAGQGAYAAANAFLDAFVVGRRSSGRHGLSVAWGAWAQVGMAADADVERGLSARGVRGMDPELALGVLERGLAADETFLSVADVDWARFAATFTAARRRPLLDLIPAAVAPRRDTAADTDGAGRFARQVSAAPPPERAGLVLDLVTAQAAAVLRYGPGEALDPARAFRDMGFDSLTAVDLRNALGRATGLALPTTLVFDHPNARALATELLRRLGADTPGAATATPVAAPGVDHHDDPVVVVGMSCRLPGGVTSPAGLWELVERGGDGIGPMPADRGWSIDGGCGGFVEGATDFDAAFFGISPREALSMDPQQRLVLEAAWEALERAGVDPTGLRGTDTGVFVGASATGYQALVDASAEAEHGYGLTGSAQAVVSGRVSYVLGLEGPALSVDTACSSSLVALHLAVQSLRRGECSLALAGGVAVMATPGAFVEFGRQGGLAADGRCKAFADAADGTGWSEGVAVLVVERLSRARERGHHVLAVVRGTAVNSDGASNGLTAPNGPSQQRVIRAALADARLTPSDVDVVEAHGTGTTLGDPIEAQAVLEAYGRDRDRPLLLGALKSNIGHTQAASGAAGVIKMVEAMRRGSVPPTLHVDTPSSHVDWSAGAVELVTEERAWPDAGRPRRAGVSAFGISGTNAHVVLEQAPAPGATDPPDAPVATPPDGPVPWVLSARGRPAVAALAGGLAGQGGDDSRIHDSRIHDVARALARSRAGLPDRAVLLGDHGADLAAACRRLAAGGTGAGVVTGAVRAGATAAVFSGQGAQRPGMGRELYARFPVFAGALDEVCAVLDVETGGSTREVLFGDDGERLSDTAFTQPALFAFEVALFRLAESWGFAPDHLIGHSIGEVVAAYLAGVWSLPDACRLVAARARLMGALPPGGAMTTVRAPAAEVTEVVDGIGGVVVAAVNAPDAVTVSGETGALTAAEQEFLGRGWKCRRLQVSHAFHSPAMDAMLDGLAETAAGLEYHQPRRVVVSNLTGAVASAELTDPGYWARHARESVRFADGIRALHDRGVTRFVEFGPSAALTPAVQATVAGGDPEPQVVALQRDDRPQVRALLTGLAMAWTTGADVDWTAVLGGPPPAPVELPTYPFQRKRYWIGPPPAGTGGDADPEFWNAVRDGDGAALAERLGLPDRGALDEVLPALAAWRRGRDEDAAVARCRYRIGWRPLTGRRPGTARRWLVLVPEGAPRADALLAELGRRDLVHAVVRIGPDGPAPDGLTPDALREAVAEGADGVLSLLADMPGRVPGQPDVGCGPAATLAAVRALDLAGAGPLWCLTRAAVAVTANAGPAVDPEQAQVWGLGRVAALEKPGRWGGLVDLPPDPSGADVDRLADVLAGCWEHDQVAVRDGAVHGRALEQPPLPPAVRRWRPRGTVLISGGTGALGVEVARWLAGRGAEHVLLLARRGESRVPGLRAELAAAGTGLTVAAADVTDRAAVAAAIDAIPADRPLRAVVHAAGVGEARPIDEIDAAGLAAVGAAKVRGADLLHELTQDRDLDAFVLFSSIAGVWGSGAQASYAAANAHLDALARLRRAQGLPATAVAWGPWAGAGMATEGDAAERLRRRGLTLMPPQLALAALGHALDRDEPDVVFADVDWARFLPTFAAARPAPLFDGLPAARTAPADPGPPDDGGGRELAAIAALTPDARRRAVLDMVRARVAAVLGLDGPDDVPVDRALRDLGFDSLTAVELRNGLRAATGLALSTTLVFDHPTAGALAEHLVRELGLVTDPVAELLGGLDRVREALAGDALTGADRLAVQSRLALLARQPGRGVAADDDPDDLDDLDGATDDELFEALDSELGSR